MTINRYTIYGLLKLTSPLHIASPGTHRLDVATMRPAYKKAGSIPLTRVQRLSFVGEDVQESAQEAPALADDDSSSADQKKRYEGNPSVPVIPANNIMGRLRRHAARHVLNALALKGETVSLQTYTALMCGAVTGNPDGRDPTFDEYRETRAHPYIGLFGGGPRLMRRYVRGHNAVPFTVSTERAGFFSGVLRHRSLDMSVTPARHSLTGYWAFTRRDDLRELSDIGLAERTISQFEATYLARQAALIAETEDKIKRNGEVAPGDTVDRLSTTAFSAIEFVLPGTIFPVTFEVEGTRAHLGLFLKSLEGFVQTERLGGLARNGFGCFELVDTYMVTHGPKGEKEEIEHVVSKGKLVDDRDDEITRAVEAWAEAATRLNAADLDRLLRAPEPEETRKHQKAARAAAKAAQEAA